MKTNTGRYPALIWAMWGAAGLIVLYFCVLFMVF